MVFPICYEASVPPELRRPTGCSATVLVRPPAVGGTAT